MEFRPRLRARDRNCSADTPPAGSRGIAFGNGASTITSKCAPAWASLAFALPSPLSRGRTSRRAGVDARSSARPCAVGANN